MPIRVSNTATVRPGQQPSSFQTSTNPWGDTSAKRSARSQVRGKFIFAGNEKLYIRGVTYGTFRTDENGKEYHNPEVVERDFAQMSANGINAVRTYTVPPYWLLDMAQGYGLRVMVGLPWEQHIAFLDDTKRVQAIEERVRAGVSSCAGHPAVLCYAIGNEIPASIVRWHGRRRVERFLQRLYYAAKAEDPDGLITYVNYPTTEYLQLPFVDFVCFNVYLESEQDFEAYLARLQNIAGERPLVMAEIGLDSRTHGEDAQAHVLDWQVRSAFAAGCAGAFVFAWTDEWHRGGYDIEDWDFGLTGRARAPKPALSAVSDAFAQAPFPRGGHWPFISVVVCSYNGARTIRDCCEGLVKLKYPHFEVIIVDDGSSDTTGKIAKEYDFRVIQTKNGGLSRARNIGMEAAKGEIIAYTDDDACPDPHWLTYLAHTFMHTDHVGVGGPNIAPAGDGAIADCVVNAPGGPVHVLLSDQEAEHIPGCNMAFWKDKLMAIGGFDPQFRTAGDDVDVCWGLQQRGWTLGFCPAAMVWHHRRNSVCTYWKQQKGYGKAEALLERKWPERYNTAGHLTWSGRLYGKGLTQPVRWLRERIYQGTWGSAAFQSIYQPASDALSSLPLMPEWYLIVVVLLGLSALGMAWEPLGLVFPLFILAAVIPFVQAILSAAQTSFTGSQSRMGKLKRYALTALLHLVQPLARLYGRLREGLTPWRRRGWPGLRFPRLQTAPVWSEQWQSSQEWLASIESAVQEQGGVITRGGDFDLWDVEIRGGFFGAARLLMAVEEHGGGKQLLRFRWRPKVSWLSVVLTLLFSSLSVLAAVGGAWVASGVLGFVAVVVLVVTSGDCLAATNAYLHVLKESKKGEA